MIAIPTIFSLRSMLISMAVGAAMGGYVVHLYYGARGASLRADNQVLTEHVAVLNDAVRRQGAAIEAQNKGVEQLKAEGEQRAVEAEKALAKAQKQADAAQKRALELLAEKHPANVSDCQAASDLITKELAR